MATTHRNYAPDTIRENLKILASFDNVGHLTGKGAKKLHIHNDGRFSVDEGRGAAFRRTFTAGVSLSDKHNRDSIENLFREATNLLVLNGLFENGLRVDIFNALRGFRYLIVNGYEGRMEALDRTFQRCRSHFGCVLKAAINGAANFTTVYSGQVMPHVTFRNVGDGQATYIETEFVEGGICFGIAAKWGLRNIQANKPSIKSSRHDQNPLNAQAVARSNYRTALEASVEAILNNPDMLEELNQKIFGNSPAMNFMNRFATRDQAKAHLMCYYETTEANNPDRLRLKNKGTEMYAIMHQQDAMLNKNQRMGDAIKNYNDPQKYFEPTTQNLLKFKPGQAGLTDQQYINALATRSDLCRIMKVDEVKFGSRQDGTEGKFYMRDFTLFSEPLDYLMLMCRGDKDYIQRERAKKNMDTVAFSYMISWSAGQHNGYGNINQSDGHALGLNFNPLLGQDACLIFDPNYAEFRCNDIKTAGEHLAKLFSLYSRDSNLNKAYLHRISISGVHHKF